MSEADKPGKLFIGRLSLETKEKTLEDIFGKYGRIIEVLLIKDRQTNKSRGFAFVTFENPSDAKAAVKDMNGKSLDGKTIKVEQAKKPFFESGGKQRPPPAPGSRGRSRSLRGARGGNGRAKGYPRGGRLDDGGYSVNTRTSSSRRPFPVKRGPPSRSEGPPPKRSAPSEAVRSTDGMGRRGSVSRGRENYRGHPRREQVSSRKGAHVTPRDESYSTRDREYPSYRDTKGYDPSPRDLVYRDYGPSGSRDEHSSRGYSDREGYGGGRYRHYLGHLSRGSYRDSRESYGRSRGALPARGLPLTYRGGSSRYDDNSVSRDGYGGSRGSDLSSRRDVYSRGREHGGRREGELPSRMDRVCPTSRESHGSSGGRVSGDGRGENRLGRGGQGRY